MALSDNASDLAYVRAFLPARTEVSTDPLYISTTMLDYLYANQAGGSLDKTIAYALQQACAKASNMVARTNTATGDTVQSQQEREAVCAMAAQWAKSTGVLTAGTALVTGFVTRQDGYSSDVDSGEA